MMMPHIKPFAPFRHQVWSADKDEEEAAVEEEKEGGGRRMARRGHILISCFKCQETPLLSLNLSTAFPFYSSRRIASSTALNIKQASPNRSDTENEAISRPAALADKEPPYRKSSSSLLLRNETAQEKSRASSPRTSTQRALKDDPSNFVSGPVNVSDIIPITARIRSSPSFTNRRADGKVRA